jgi:hypothetical protein
LADLVPRAIAVFCSGRTHTTGFHERFPELLGLAPWPVWFFVSFNLFWLAIWILSAWALGARRRAAFFPLWFLAIGCSANGVAHPLLSMRTRGYFPGLVTSLLVDVVGILLLRRLALITEPHAPWRGSGAEGAAVGFMGLTGAAN